MMDTKEEISSPSHSRFGRPDASNCRFTEDGAFAFWDFYRAHYDVTSPYSIKSKVLIARRLSELGIDLNQITDEIVRYWNSHHEHITTLAESAAFHVPLVGQNLKTGQPWVLREAIASATQTPRPTKREKEIRNKKREEKEKIINASREPTAVGSLPATAAAISAPLATVTPAAVQELTQPAPSVISPVTPPSTPSPSRARTVIEAELQNIDRKIQELSNRESEKMASVNLVMREIAVRVSSFKSGKLAVGDALIKQISDLLVSDIKICPQEDRTAINALTMRSIALNSELAGTFTPTWPESPAPSLQPGMPEEFPEFRKYLLKEAPNRAGQMSEKELTLKTVTEKMRDLVTLIMLAELPTVPESLSAENYVRIVNSVRLGKQFKVMDDVVRRRLIAFRDATLFYAGPDFDKEEFLDRTRLIIRPTKTGPGDENKIPVDVRPEFLKLYKNFPNFVARAVAKANALNAENAATDRAAELIESDVLLALYTLIPPGRRLDYCRMKWVDDDPLTNVCVITNSAEDSKFILREYKESRIYHDREFVGMPLALYTILKAWKLKCNSPFVLPSPTDPSGPISFDTFNNYMNKIFGTTDSVLRMVYVTLHHGDPIEQRKIDAERMLHSYDIHCRHYDKEIEKLIAEDATATASTEATATS
jgi:hypothetical protein